MKKPLVQRSLPTFEEPVKPDPEAEKRWRAKFYRELGRAERRYGRGQTFPDRWIVLITEGIVPEWVCRGYVIGETRELRERCDKAFRALERLHKDLFHGRS